MFIKKTLPSVCKAEAASLMKKRLAALFIFACMLINGFAMSTVEIGRHSLFMITIAATQNIVSSVVGKYNDSLMEVSSKVYTYVGHLLFDNSSEAGMTNNGKDERKQKSEKGHASQSGMIIKSPMKEIRKAIHNDSAKSVAVFSYADVLFAKYADSKTCPLDMCGLSLLFLVFIAAIRQRKGINEKIIITNKIWKTRISA